jgi:ribosomal protein L37E
MGVVDENWMKWALATFSVDLDNLGEIRQTCERCGYRMYPGIWEFQCDQCGYRTKYIIPVNPVETWSDPGIPGRYGQELAKVTNHVK